MGDDSEDFDARMYALIERHLRRARELGHPEEEASILIGQALTQAVDATAPAVTAHLIESMPQMVREHQRMNRRFERALRSYWGHGLDILYSVIVASEEYAGGFFRKHRGVKPVSLDLFDALAGVQARACRTAFEIHLLLAHGYPLGALARCRTLYELAVTAIVLGEWGQREKHPDLATRFLEHDAISNLSDARVFQSHADALGERPYTASEMSIMEQRRARLITKYGPGFAEQYGWAASLFRHDPKFVQLEDLSGIAHLRPYYKWSSHAVHSGAKGFVMNTTQDGKVTRLETGRTLAGIAEPGHLAVILLTHCTLSYLFDSVTTASPESMLAAKSILLLARQAGEALDHGSLAVEQYEVNRHLWRLRRAAQHRGRRRTIVRRSDAPRAAAPVSEESGDHPALDDGG